MWIKIQVKEVGQETNYIDIAGRGARVEKMLVVPSIVIMPAVLVQP